MIRNKGIIYENKKVMDGFKPFNLTFARNSVAYDSQANQYPINKPRFYPGRGILIEKATTNEWVANQATGGDTNSSTEGFAKFKGTETLEYQTSVKYEGTGAIHCHTPGSETSEGFWLSKVVSEASKPYSNTFRLKLPLNATVLLYYSDNNYHTPTQTNITGTGEWEEYTILRTADADTTIIMCFLTRTNAQAIDMYFDFGMLEKASKNTTYANLTRAAETLSIPTGNIRLNGWTIEQMVYIPTVPTTNTYYIGSGSASYHDWIAIYQDAAGLGVFTTDHDGNVSSISTAPTNITTGLNYLAITCDSEYLTAYINGVQAGTPVANPYMPSVDTPIYIGSIYTGTSQPDIYFKQTVISNHARPANEILQRKNHAASNGSYLIDKYVTSFADTSQAIKAYQQRNQILFQ